MPRKASSGRKSSGKAKAPKSRQKFTRAPAYLKKLSTAVRGHFEGAVDLPTFLATAGTLTSAQRKTLVRQALILIEQNYVHLPLKRAMHAIDPVQRLKLLLQFLEQDPPVNPLSEVQFHREMTDIFTSLRDLHTNYLLPAPFNAMTAFLPFMVEDYVEDGKRKYVVSHIAQGFTHETFVVGVEIVYWNGVPIERAVLNNAKRYAGSNGEASHARGVQTLTSRALRIAPPPDEEWVDVGYQSNTGGLREIRISWMVNPPLPAGSQAVDSGMGPLAAVVGLDLEQEIIQEVRKALFAPQVVAAEKKAAEKVSSGAQFGALESSMPNIFEAKPVTTPSGTFGYLRIRTFNSNGVDEFVNEFIRLVEALPANGLIIDVRGNGGGIIMNGELILQVLTPRRIEPEPVQFINSPLNLSICRQNNTAAALVNLSPWLESMKQALQTGSAFSTSYPISDPNQCNAIGQKYFGPVVLITDALCYSTTDIFSAGFQDHEIGPVIGTDGNTGAGGANVWGHDLLSVLLPGSASVYQPLPGGASMRVAMRRTLRVGKRAGTPVEDLGVIPDVRHSMTRNDLLNGNVDLINKAGSLLANLPVRVVKVTLQPESPTQISALVTTENITRLDVYLAERPFQSLDVQQGQTQFHLIKPAGASIPLEIRGFDNNQLVARYLTTV